MSSDIKSILEKFSALEEGATTPAYVKKGLNKQQKSVPQLPALFKPKSASPALTSKDYPQHPMKGYMVGANESEEPRTALEGYMASVEEDMVTRVRNDLNRYLDKLSNEYHDDGYKDQKPQHLDQLSKKQQVDHDLMDKALDAVERGEVEDEQMSEPIESVMMEDGSVMEIHGDQDRGFEIYRLGKKLPTQFPSIDHAKMAIDIFRNRHKQQALDADYIEEK